MPDVSRVIVRAPNWLGDAVLALPAMAAIRRGFAQRTVIVAARASIAPLFEEQTPAAPDEVVAIDSDREVEQLRALHADAIVLFPNSFGSAWTARRARVPDRWGFGTSGRGILLTRRAAPPRGRVHQVEYYNALARGLDFDVPVDARPTLAPSAWAIQRAATLLDLPRGVDLPPKGGSYTDAPTDAPTYGPPSDPAHDPVASAFRRKISDGSTQIPTQDPVASAFRRKILDAPPPLLVGFAPGAAYGHAKRWPPDRVAQVIARLSAQGITSVLVGAKDDRETSRAIESSLPQGARVIDLVGRTSLRELVGVIARCAAFVSNDSGAMHIAAALGVPLTATFGPTDERVTSPAAPAGRADVILRDVFCRPCMLRECPIDHRCMKRIDVDSVIHSISGHLA